MDTNAHSWYDTSQIISNIFTKNIDKFKNRHAGESCYIFGDGPSIKWFDLTQFNNHPAICCGLIPFHKDFDKLDVRYIALIEPWLFTPKLFQPNFLHGYREIASELKKCLETRQSVEVFVNLSNIFNLRGENINYIYRKLPNPRSKAEKELNQVGCFSGSFHATITLAYYMGFRKLYLVGFDAWTIQPARTLRWYELGDGEYFNPTNFAFDFLNVIRPDVEIYTISKDGESSNATNINYTTFTGKQPKYKENFELLSSSMLKVIGTCQAYNIFPKKTV